MVGSREALRYSSRTNHRQVSYHLSTSLQAIALLAFAELLRRGVAPAAGNQQSAALATALHMRRTSQARKPGLPHNQKVVVKMGAPKVVTPSLTVAVVCQVPVMDKLSFPW